MIIKARVLHPGYKAEFLRDVYVVIEGDRIVDVTKKRPEGDVIEAEFVTPGFVDPHSHIGMARHGEPRYEEETNERLDEIRPLNDPLDGIYFDDRAFDDAIHRGVLYSCVIPGSGNVLGGKAAVIRNFARHRGEAVVRYIGYKMALGFNPRSTTSRRGTRPNTRMGVYSLLEKRFLEVLRKKEKLELKAKKELRGLAEKLREKKITLDEYEEIAEETKRLAELELTPDELALLDLLSGKPIAKVHVHKEDDVYYLIRLVRRFGLRATADHTGDVHHAYVRADLHKNGIGIVYGPIDSLAYKVELKHDTRKNVRELMKSGAFFGIMSDHPVVLVNVFYLQMRYFLRFGMSAAEAIKVLTYHNAKLVGVDDIIGSIRPGMKASLVLRTGNPFDVSNYPEAVVLEGEYRELKRFLFHAFPRLDE